jgi:ribonuclease HI
MPQSTDLTDENPLATIFTRPSILARREISKIYFHGRCGRRITRQSCPMKLIVGMNGDFYTRALSCIGPNEVAFKALIWALELARAQRKSHVLLSGHNKVVIDFVNRIKQPRDERMITLFEKYVRLASQFEWIRVRYIPKRENHAVPRGPN